MKRLLTSTALMAAMALPGWAQEYTPDPDATPGGTITVTYKDDVATLDPAIGYDWQNWSMIKSLFDGLMDYVPGTTELRPGLAESYEINEDGTVFTFKLREGVTFHNGREMTAEDVKYSLDRVTSPETQSPGAGFFASVEGFDAISDGSADTLSGVEVVDPTTVKITLSRPDATFLHVMALNFASVVPKEAVDEYGTDFGKHPVGTGAFKLGEWTIGQRLVFEKNADYWRDGVPYLDGITFEVGQEPIVALLRLQQGEVDVPGDGIPPAKFQEVMSDPSQAEHVVEGGQLHTGYITLNVGIEPLDQLEVREAINMAINKERITQIINGRAVPASQPLPPSMPGYTEGYDGYRLRCRRCKGQARRGRTGGWFQHRALRDEHRPEPAHRPGHPAGSEGDRRHRGHPQPRPGQRDRGRRSGCRPDDLVRRHGLDRGLPRSVQLLRAHPRLRGDCRRRLELVQVL